MAAKGFNSGDAILRAAIREQAGSTVKRLHRDGTIENIGAVARVSGSWSALNIERHGGRWEIAR